MAPKPKQPKAPKQVEALKHEEASRKNIPTAEYQSLMPKETAAPVEVATSAGGRVSTPRKGCDEQWNL